MIRFTKKTMNIPSDISTKFLFQEKNKDKISIYQLFKSFSSKELHELIKLLRKKNIPIKNIYSYEYQEAKGIKHLFFLFDGNDSELDYFQLQSELYQEICNEAIKFYLSIR